MNVLSEILPYLIFIGCFISTIYYLIYFRLFKENGRWIKFSIAMTMLAGVIFYAFIIIDKDSVPLLVLRLWIFSVIFAHTINSTSLVHMIKVYKKKLGDK